jgi:tartrate dehydrogenase/decarboxylase/D-malate dehydrogenase
MLRFLADTPGADPAYRAAHDAIVAAIEKVLKDGPRTPDLGGRANTVELGSAIAALI